MRIEFIFDTVCPWCYVGKHRLERALAMRPDTRADIHWRPFLLNPDIPAEGIDRQAYLERKFGGPARVQRVQTAVATAAELEGIVFAFDRITRTPNTVNSHRLIRLAADFGLDREIVEAIGRAYFCEGRDIGEIGELYAIGAKAGLPPAELDRLFASDDHTMAVMSDNSRAHRLGVNGVPCLILNGAYAIAGAQEPDVLLRLIDIARESESETLQAV